MVEALGRSTDYRILRRLVARPTYVPTLGQEVRTGILLDTETTGLDANYYVFPEDDLIRT